MKKSTLIYMNMGLHSIRNECPVITKFNVEHGPSSVQSVYIITALTTYRCSAVMVARTNAMKEHIVNILKFAKENNTKIYVNNDIFSVSAFTDRPQDSTFIHVRLYPARLEQLKMQIWKFVNSAKKTYTSIFKT